MEIRGYYTFHAINDKNFKKWEKTLRDFFLNNSDTLRLTRITWGSSLFGLITIINKKSGKTGGTDNDPKFIEFRDSIKKDFIKKIVSNKKYSNIKQPLKQKFEHYFYKLSEKIKTLINKNTLFFNLLLSKSSDDFYGLEDPTFYKKGKMLGCVISHEQQISLFLTNKEKEMLERKGIEFIETK